VEIRPNRARLYFVGNTAHSVHQWGFSFPDSRKPARSVPDPLPGNRVGWRRCGLSPPSILDKWVGKGQRAPGPAKTILASHMNDTLRLGFSGGRRPRFPASGYRSPTVVKPYELLISAVFQFARGALTIVPPRLVPNYAHSLVPENPTGRPTQLPPGVPFHRIAALPGSATEQQGGIIRPWPGAIGARILFSLTVPNLFPFANTKAERRPAGDPPSVPCKSFLTASHSGFRESGETGRS